MATFDIVDAEAAKDVRCAICLDPWTDPVELAPCGHVFCRRCASASSSALPFGGVCPTCRAALQPRLVEPNRILRNIADDVVVRCQQCGWRGAHARRFHHPCGNNAAASAVPPPKPSPASTTAAVTPATPPRASSNGTAWGARPFAAPQATSQQASLWSVGGGSAAWGTSGGGSSGAWR